MNQLLKKSFGIILAEFTLLLALEAQFFPTISISLTDIPADSKVCYSSNFSLACTVTPFTPVYNPDFNIFLNGIANSFSSYPRVVNAIKNTNYSYMAGYLYLWNDLPSNKNTIAEDLRREVMSRNTYLTNEEMNKIYTNFFAAAYAQSSWPPPYYSYLYKWEYMESIRGSDKPWKILSNPIGESATVKFIPKNFLPALQDKATVTFKAVAFNTYTGKYCDIYSNAIIVDVLPEPPKAGSIYTNASCVNKPSGEIVISDITGEVPTNLFTYRIVNSNSSCGDWDHNTIDITTNNAIDHAYSGNYKLCLTYTATDLKNCYSEQSFTVGFLPELKYSSIALDVSCPGSADGSIEVNLTTWAGRNKIIVNGVTINDAISYIFYGLSQKEYDIKVSDACFDDITTTKKINQPEFVIITSVTSKDPTCNNPGNGGFDISVSGLSEGLYDFYIYNSSGSLVVSKTGQSSSWFYNSLSDGTYRINVRDHAHPNCEGVSKSITLNPVVPLNLTLKLKTNVVCFGESTGEIQLIGSGGSGYYNIKLGSKIITTNPAIFSSLPKSSYNFEITNTDQTCSDVKTFTEEILSNEKINITLTPQDVKCFGNQDGQIGTLVREGTGTYRYFTWELLKNSNWIFFSTTQSPKDLDIGLYRLTVEDNGGCKASAITEIKQPASLLITNVSKVDARCFGETGKIDITSSGGNGGDFYQYSTNDVDYSTFSSGSSFLRGQYYLKVRDIKGCETKWQNKVEISEPSPLDFTSTSPNYNGYSIKCFGEATGSIILNPQGGNLSYIFSIDGVNFQSQNQFSNLVAGSYNITVKDIRNCSLTRPITLTQPSKLTLPIPVVDNVKCFGLATGKILVSPTGAVAPFVFEINGSTHGSSGDFIGLPAGNYNIKVTDKNGCNQALSSIVINKNQQIKTTLTPQNVRCAGENNGRITVITTGGSGGFSHIWEKVPGGTLSSGSGIPDIQGLSPGLYRLKLTDSDQCSASDSAKIMTPLPLSVSGVTPHDIVCFGGSGSIDISATGGNGGYTFSNSLDNWVSWSNFISGVPLTAAVYKLKVTDIMGCETKWNNDVKITGPASALNFSTNLSAYNGFNISCYGVSDGNISINPSGGNGTGYNGYSFSFAGVGYNSQSTYSNLTSGTYSISVKDGRGCIVTQSISLTQPAQIGLMITNQVNTKCFNDSSGLVTLTASGGALLYEYMIGQKIFVSTNEFGKLPAGNYVFTVRDKNNCSNTISSVITNIYPKPSVALIPQDISCYQKSDGVIQSSLTGGSGSFGLKWYEKSGNLWQYLKSDSTRITSLSPGVYLIQVTDLAGCPAISDSTSVYQTVTQLVIDNVSMHDIVCYGESGSIDIQASGSNGGYTYQYSKDNQPFVNYSSGTLLGAGSYKLKVKDAKRCETLWPDNKIITSPTETLGLTWLVKDYNGYNVSCFGSTNGRLAIKASGGNGAGYRGYSLLLSGRPAQSDTLFDNLGAGDYNIRITDGRGCTINRPVSITQPSAAVGLSVSKLVDTKCFNDSTGIISLTSSGGVLPYEFRIDQKNFAGTNEFGKLPTGSYYFTMRDKNGCSNSLNSTIKNIYPKPALSLTPQEISCYQINDGSVRSSLTGGSGSFGLKWFIKSSGLWKYLIADSTQITGLAPGDYRIQATDLAGCPAIYDSTTVFQNVTPLVLDYVLQQDIKCFGDSGSINIHASGSNGDYIYQYSKNNQSYISYSSGAPLLAATYNLRVKDAKGCITSWPESKVITQPSEPLGLRWIAKDFAGYNVSCFGNNDGLISVKSWGGNAAGYNGYSYSLSDRSVQTDTLFENLKAGNYKLEVTDGRGCTLEKNVTLTQAKSELGLWTTSIKQATCFDGSDGMVSLTASGGSLPYSFSAGNEIFVPGNEFSNLEVDKYHFTVKDANGCTQILDTSIFNIIPKMNITGIVSDVRCIGQNNGTIGAVVSGGVKPFSYQWKEITFSNPNIVNLYKGNYTLSVLDSAGCRAEKLFEVKEPSEPLVISRVALHDIICYNDSGSIDIQAWGSNGGYIYQYSKDNQPFVNYYSGTKLPSAEYKLKVKDVKGCETLWPENVIITQPPKALGLEWIAKDYNGSNVSCFGKNDGQLIVKSYGGNGAGYQGYTYHLQGRPIQTDTLFSDLSAGTYFLSLTDSRSCTIMKVISIKQPTHQVSLSVSRLVNTKCFNDSTGVITLAATGGVQPYEFMIDQKDFVSDNEFGKLPIGLYHFLVRDKNGCPGALSSAITNIYQKPDLKLIPQDIRCYQEKDGTILASFTGGSGKFDIKWYQKIVNSWQLIKSDGNSIRGLVPGEYRIQAIDRAGCPPIYDSTTIYQKVTPLFVEATSQSACAQTQNGTIITSAYGGTSPYQFAVDQSGMQKNSSFQVYGGQHKVYASDAYNCRAETEINVDVRNTMPLINFMVATSRYELDTLVIKDVSLPKPDRVSWEFSPEALLITTNQYEARVKYSSTGIYPVRMTGYFGTCDYTLEKLLNIAPFDPLVNAKDKYLSGIESVQISPNPNNGLFKVKVKLYTKQQVQIKILDYYSKLWYSNRYPVAMEFEQEINIPESLPGTYVLWVICDNDSRAVLFIISQ